MPFKTPDRFEGTRLEEESKFDRSSAFLVGGAGAFRFDDATGAWIMVDDVGAFDPRTGGGLSEAQHRALLQLIHFISEGPAKGFSTGATKTVTGGLFPTLIEWKRADATLLLAKTITRTGTGTNVSPTPIEWKLYDTDGTTVLETVTDVITYSGVIETSRVRTIA